MGNSSSQEEEARKGASHPNKRNSAAVRALQQQQQQSSHSIDSQQEQQQQQKQAQDRGGAIPNVQQDFDSREAHSNTEGANQQTSGSMGQRHVESATPASSNSSNNNNNNENSKNGTHEEFVEHVESAPQSSETTPMPVPVPAAPNRPQYIRRKSAIVLDEAEDEADQLQQMSLNNSSTGEEGETPTSLSVNRTIDDHEDNSPKYDSKIEWRQGGRKVYVTGSFTGWRKMIMLTRQDDGNFSAVIKLPLGTHRLRFVVDNEMRCSDFLQTATDSMGNLVNYIVVDVNGIQPPPKNSSSEEEYEEYNEEDEDLNYMPKLGYCSEIPEVFTNPEVMDRFVSSEFTTPPQLPPHLEGVILNSNSTEKDNNSVLPIPNHVVLNHLATTSIKHNVLAVASISRYSRKYVTQVLYAPL